MDMQCYPPAFCESTSDDHWSAFYAAGTGSVFTFPPRLRSGLYTFWDGNNLATMFLPTFAESSPTAMYELRTREPPCWEDCKLSPPGYVSKPLSYISAVSVLKLVGSICVFAGVVTRPIYVCQSSLSKLVHDIHAAVGTSAMVPKSPNYD